MSVESSPIISKKHTSQLSSEQSELVDRGAKKMIRGGDVLDNMRRIRRLKIGGPVGALGAGTMGAYLSNFNIANIDNTPGITTIVLGTAVAEIAAGRIAKAVEKKKTKKILRIHDSLSDITDSTIDVYRYKEGRIGKQKKKLAIRWYGLPNEEAAPHVLRDHLAKVAAVGKEVKAEEILLPLPSVEKYITVEKAEEYVTQTEWLKERKKRSIKDSKHGDDPLIIVSTDELDEIVNKVEVIEENEPLDSIMQVLQKKQPSHPANALYAHFSLNPDVIREKLRRLFKVTIEARTDDSVRVVETHGDITLRTSLPRAASLGKSRRTGRPQAVLRNASHWGEVEFIDLLREKGIDRRSFADVLSNPDRFPRATVRDYAELAAWMTLEGYDVGLGKGEGLHISDNKVENVETSDSHPTFQQRVVDHELGIKVEGKLRRKRIKKTEREMKLRAASRMRRTARSAAIVLIGAGLGAGIGYSIDAQVGNLYERKDTIYETLKAGEKDWLEKFEEIDEKSSAQAREEMPIADKVEQYVLNPLYDIQGKSRRTAIQLGQIGGLYYTSEDLQRYVTENTQNHDCSGCDTRVGNVVLGENKPLWYLESYNGMQSDGYWAEQGFRYMDYTGVAWRSTLASEYREQENKKSTLLPLPNTLDKKQPLIKVERAINFESIDHEYFSPYVYYGTQTLMVLPILEGTHLVAGIVGENMPVEEVTMPNGISIITFPGMRGIQTVEYWLAPGDTTPVKATGPVSPEELITAEVANTIWSKYIDTPLPNDPVKREAFERDYIQNNFDYRLAPLPPTNDLYQREAYMNMVLALKQGNCNIVNNLLILSNPDLLNGVSGFLNANNPESTRQYLSGNESHFYAVDAKGKIHDATPSNVLPEEAAFFDENFNDAVLEDPAVERRQNYGWLFGFGILAALGGAGYYKRRELYEAYLHTDKLAHTAAIAMIPDAAVANAYSALSHEFYASSPTPWSGEPPMRHDLTGTPATREEILGMFESYTEPTVIFSAQAQARTAAVTPMYAAAHRRALRDGARIIGHLQRISTAEKKLDSIKK